MDADLLASNKLGLKDAAQLRAAEADFSAARASEFRASGASLPLSFEGLKQAHRVLFRDVYPWAGEVRAVNISKGESPFCDARFLDPAAKDIFGKLAKENNLAGLDQDTFAARAAHYFSEINALHPFREGNGRSQRLWFSELAKNAGYSLDWQRVDREKYLDAVKEGFHTSTAKLAGVIRDIAAPLSRQVQQTKPTNLERLHQKREAEKSRPGRSR
jgi:cell filamentation protein